MFKNKRNREVHLPESLLMYIDTRENYIKEMSEVLVRVNTDGISENEKNKLNKRLSELVILIEVATEYHKIKKESE